MLQNSTSCRPLTARPDRSWHCVLTAQRRGGRAALRESVGRSLLTQLTHALLPRYEKPKLEVKRNCGRLVTDVAPTSCQQQRQSLKPFRFQPAHRCRSCLLSSTSTSTLSSFMPYIVQALSLTCASHLKWAVPSLKSHKPSKFTHAPERADCKHFHAHPNQSPNPPPILSTPKNTPSPSYRLPSETQTSHVREACPSGQEPAESQVHSRQGSRVTGPKSKQST